LPAAGLSAGLFIYQNLHQGFLADFSPDASG